MSDFPFLLVMIAVPAVGAAVVAALPKGRDLLAKQLALGVSLVVLLLAVLATVAFDAGGDRFQLTTTFAWIPDFGVRVRPRRRRHRAGDAAAHRRARAGGDRRLLARRGRRAGR